MWGANSVISKSLKTNKLVEEYPNDFTGYQDWTWQPLGSSSVFRVVCGHLTEVHFTSFPIVSCSFFSNQTSFTLNQNSSQRHKCWYTSEHICAD